MENSETNDNGIDIRMKKLFTDSFYISEEDKENVRKAIIDATEKMLKSSPLLIRKKPNNC